MSWLLFILLSAPGVSGVANHGSPIAAVVDRGMCEAIGASLSEALNRESVVRQSPIRFNFRCTERPGV
jgi:hypothetical protein